jgi:Cu(I)/Ag(I) efflux system protein CusF
VKRFAVLALGLALSLAAPLYAQPKKLEDQAHKGAGVVTNIDRAGGKVTLKHDPIKSLNWPTMTMVFAVKDKAMLEKLAKGKKVEFEFVQRNQQFVITSIK